MQLLGTFWLPWLWWCDKVKFTYLVIFVYSEKNTETIKRIPTNLVCWDITYVWFPNLRAPLSRALDLCKGISVSRSLAWKPSSDILISMSMTNHSINHLIHLHQGTCHKIYSDIHFNMFSCWNTLKVQQNEVFVANSIENLNINFCCHSFALLHTWEILLALVELID